MSAARLLPLALVGLVAACTGSRQAPEAQADDRTGREVVANPSGGEARLLFDALDRHCGRAFPGTVERDEPTGADPAWSAGAPILHLRACEPGLKALSVVRGDDRALVWLLTVREGRLRIQHLDYNDDATPRPGSSRFGLARADSPAGRVLFDPEVQDSAAPAPTVSLALDDDALVYESTGEQRRLRVRFDLRRAIPAPPLPWMEAPIR